MLNEAAAEPELGKSLVGVCLKSTEVNEQARRSHASEEAETIFQLATATTSHRRRCCLQHANHFATSVDIHATTALSSSSAPGQHPDEST